jgi:hypothetical protein
MSTVPAWDAANGTYLSWSDFCVCSKLLGLYKVYRVMAVMKAAHGSIHRPVACSWGLGGGVLHGWCGGPDAGSCCHGM